MHEVRFRILGLLTSVLSFASHDTKSYGPLDIKLPEAKPKTHIVTSITTNACTRRSLYLDRYLHCIRIMSRLQG